MSNNIKPLFDLAEIPPRPTYTPEMTKQVAINIVKRMYSIKDEELNKKAQELINVYLYVFSFDGYEMAKQLEEEYGWCINTEEVNELENMRSYIHELLMDEQKRWVAKYNVVAPYPAGTKVMIRGINLVGVIEEPLPHYRAKGQSLIKIEGTPDDSRRHVVYYEDLTHCKEPQNDTSK